MRTCFHVLKECLVALSLPTAWTSEIHQLQDLLDAPMHLSRLLSTSTVLDGARPTALHLDAMLAVKAIAARALERKRRDNELAQPTDEKFDCWSDA